MLPTTVLTALFFLLFRIVSADPPPGPEIPNNKPPNKCVGAGKCLDPEVLKFESSKCTKYHILSVRGTDSTSPGWQGELLRLICVGLDPNDCGWENLEYPAQSRFKGEKTWCESATIGARNGQAQLTKYAERCPSSELIVLGFSQGGSVALDVLGGGGGHTYKCEQGYNPALDRNQSPGNRIAAAVAFGSVRRTANQTYDVKGGKAFNGQGIRNEEQLRGLNQYADVLRSYCNHGDGQCAVGSEPESIRFHLAYFVQYTEEAGEWVVKTVKQQERRWKYGSTLTYVFSIGGPWVFFAAVVVALGLCALLVYLPYRKSKSKGQNQNQNQNQNNNRAAEEEKLIDG
jgi:hypothetical protein